MHTLTITTTKRIEMIDITGQIRTAVSESDWSDGVITVYCPHTTAAVTINEAADPSVQSDILNTLSKLVPYRDNYQHMEGNSDAHVKASIIGPSEQVMMQHGRLVLGTWQGIFFCEFDGPRERKCHIHFRSDR